MTKKIITGYWNKEPIWRFETLAERMEEVVKEAVRLKLLKPNKKENEKHI